MWAKLFCLLISVSLAAAVPLDITKADGELRNGEEARIDNPNAIEALILRVIEELRELMLNGSDAVPVLDPLFIEEVSVDDELIPLPGTRLSIKDTTVKNLATFEIDELSVQSLLIINRINLGGYIPVIEIDNDFYDIFLSVMGFTLYGTGRSSIKVIEPRIRAQLEIRLELTGNIRITRCDVQFSLASFEPEITGIFGHDGVSEFLGWFLQDLVRQLLEIYEDEINEVLSIVVKAVIEELLP